MIRIVGSAANKLFQTLARNNHFAAASVNKSAVCCIGNYDELSIET